MSVSDTEIACFFFLFVFQEYFYTVLATLLYFIAFIVILAGFSYCAGSAWCDTRIAAGVRNYLDLDWTIPDQPIHNFDHKISRSTIFIQFRNVVRRILKLHS